MQEGRNRFVFRKLDSIQVKGKEKPVFIYELVGRIGEVSNDTLDMIRTFENALALYVQGNFQEGGRIFMDLHQRFQDPPALTFSKRCAKLIEEGAPEGWQGVYRATEK